MRVGVLWTGLSGYLNACLRELAGREGVELFVSHQAPSSNAPFDETQFAWMPRRCMWRGTPDLPSLTSQLRAFDPEILLTAGWHVGAYRRLAHERRGKSLRVMGMDNCWLGSPKQIAGALIAPWFLHPLADMVWLPGERQAIFARKLGFKQEAILRGLYSCEQPRLAEPHLERVREGRPLARAFLFAGRFVPAKGIEVLVKAYQLYRSEEANPWSLICCGTGPLRTLLENQPGIRVDGFVQPSDMPVKLASAGCFILPSNFEPWAVVVHEAASAGLIVLASEQVGAAVHLVQPNYNGFIFDGRSAEGLARLMQRVSSMNEARLEAMSDASNVLSQQFSPARWADTLIDAFAVRRNSTHLQ